MLVLLAVVAACAFAAVELLSGRPELFAAVWGGGLLLWLTSFVQSRRAWGRAARSLDLEPVAPGPFRLGGRLRGLRVVAESYVVLVGAPLQLRSTRLLVHLEQRVSSELTVVRRGVNLLPGSAPEPSVGDPAFDRRVVVVGRTAEVLARLDAETRAELAQLVEAGVSLRDRALVWEWRGLTRRAGRLAQRLQRLAGLAERLAAAHGQEAARLYANASEDPVEAVRERCLTALLRDYRTSDEARLAAEDAIGHPAPDVRLLAALVRGAEANDTLEALLEAESIDMSHRLGALDALRRWPDRPFAEEQLDRLLAGPASRLRLEAIRMAGLLRHRGAEPRLLELIERGYGDELPLIAEALHQLGDRRSEGTLLALLGHPKQRVVRAAALGLGQLGSVAAVEPLLALAKGRATSAPLRQAARNAVAAIQGRLEGATTGGLSLVESAEGGEVSLATEQAGQLAVVEVEEE